MTNTTITTPLRKQYLDIKRRYPDALLLFRIGDFYEAFDGDARTLARELGIMLTSKAMGKQGRVPLAGVPHHSLERHLATLISRGHRVAICEQMSDAPARGKKLIDRDVVRVVTPGTVLEPGLLKSKANNYLAAYVVEGNRAGIAYADITTGEFAATEIDQSELVVELQRISPAETLIAEDTNDLLDETTGAVTRCDRKIFELPNARRALFTHFNSRTLAPFGLAQSPLAVRAAGAIITYLHDTQATSGVVEQLTRLSSYTTANFMRLDAQTVQSLEVFEAHGDAPSLFALLDRTRTAMGARALRRWLRQPLLDTSEILRRQEHVAWFVAHTSDRGDAARALETMDDIERLASRARARLASVAEVFMLGQSLAAIPNLRLVLQRDARRLGEMLNELPACDSVRTLIQTAIIDSPARRKNENFIREGFSTELDELRNLLRDGRKYLTEMERRERERTGIRSLRVGYNKVFGYYIEVTRPNLHLVPSDYTRKQTLANAERFITLELKEHETMVMHAEERIAELEATLFRHVCSEIGKHRQELMLAARTIAYMDAVVALASVSAENNYTRPQIQDTDELFIEEGRHPMLEAALNSEGEFGEEQKTFVANNVNLGGERAPRIVLLTGPNLSGKSTYLRQTALCVLLAQIGCFVPASEARIGLCDRVFTRAGLYDRIGSGESTFMTEMIEAATILHHATSRSLLVFDELGRGTSTYDGLAVARAVIEYIHNHPQLQARTLFATHYHELTELENLLPRLANFHVEIAEANGELIFLHKVSRGSAERSYGVYAAKLAGMPAPVVRRAEELLEEYEAREEEIEAVSGNSMESNLLPHNSKIVQEILSLDLNSLSPVEALMKIYELRRIAETQKENSIRAIRSA
jgi:DNA mismatch repair protein MutS